MCRRCATNAVLLKPAGAETHTHAAAVDRYGFRLGIATWIHRAGRPLSFVQECPLVRHTVPAACKPSRARGLNGKPPRCGFLRRLPVCTLAWLRVPCDGSAWMAPELHCSCGRLLASHRPHTRRSRTGVAVVMSLQTQPCPVAPLPPTRGRALSVLECHPTPRRLGQCLPTLGATSCRAA